ncbi:uncharacterized protein F5147DRAFT_716580 [Suillus discolor]|uniref:Uncharacterized protein n=1 Tax=Suillus discolor TaxID=1912936 RepID=A0A9P7EZ40_9AGAM|nr:uncharacterized protein F5147DRAFT_716580 [Suillus discolor]KAG2096547.1 hypothetical protein F5147DRAFT_716580 [Suillus discolor]
MQKQTNSYGQLLPDQIDRISSLFDAHLGLLADARELYRERAALERDYATKLKQLAKKASEKKNKNELLLVLGDKPDKAYTESVIQQNTLNHAYSEILSSMSSSAQDHINLAEAWSQITESLKAVERRNDDYKKKQMQFFSTILAGRDKIYAERIKSKQKYDADCAEVEIHRQKQSVHDRHAERSARQYDLQRLDMLNSKNVYIISTATANNVKTKFYTEDLPRLEDSFQELQTRLVMDFVGVMREAQNIQLSHQNILKDRLTAVIAALIEVQPDKDQALFADYNIHPFSLPNDWVFEPCSNHYDTGDICIDSGPKVLLQNKLARSRAKLRELDHVLGKKRTDAEKYHVMLTACATNNTPGDMDDAMNSYLDTAHEVTALSTSACVLNSEINMIAEVLGGDEGGSSPHVFKSSAFSIPTTCGYCKVSIWGLSKQGKTCKSCGLSVHSKCELNVPAECSNVHGNYKASEILQSPSSAMSISESRSSVSTSSRKTPIPSSSSVPHNTSLHVEETHRLARAIFDFAASSSFELNVTEGTVVRVVEEDDGSGWVKVADSNGEKGLVPATYLEDAGGWPLEKSEPSQRDSQQASGIYVRALYDYRAQESGELTINEGDLVELSSGTNGGQNYADGWWEGIQMVSPSFQCRLTDYNFRVFQRREEGDISQ